VEALTAELEVTVPGLREVPFTRIVAATQKIGPAHRFWPTATGDFAAPIATLQAAARPRRTLISTTADEKA
jgi:hypothetical protein